MTIQTKYNEVDSSAWSELVKKSPTGNWFQTPKAYEFFGSLPELFRPFVVALSSESGFRGVCVGYITVEGNPLKQFATRRAIIVGGPALAEDCTNEELETLMRQVRVKIEELGGAIYIETRNFNDYSRWRDGFERAGFVYEEHLNFHVHTNQPWERLEDSIGKHRRKYIRLSYRDGARVVEKPTLSQVQEYYGLLQELYRTKIKTPLQPWNFFDRLFKMDSCRFILIEFDGKIVGGSVCMLLPKCGVYEWYACGKDGEYKNIYPSSVTKYAGMKYACENGFPIFDMMGAGKPGVEYGVRDFKAEFGGELVEHGRYKCICKPLFYKCGTLGVKMIKLLR